MARRRGCTPKTIQKVAIKKCGRGKTKHCVVATIHKDERRATIRTKGGGKLVDGGKRMLGGYKSAREAQAQASKWMSKKNGVVC